MNSLTAFNLKQWIEDHREQLRPPVCNQQVFEEDDFIVMIVGGPNSRDDYHVDEGPEFFYQLEGDMLLRTVQDEKRVDIRIREGDVLLLPPCVPHSPQRFENTVGLVIERKRLDHELDGFMWFCNECDNKLYEEFLYIEDIVLQLPPIFDRFFSSKKNRTCTRCGTVKERPA
ncbi:MAG: 3-hydroxyanthranilate 3,4-dioxygenase [Gammaproteobacteria bacterium]|nr:3-hydroxyanthranilate 3,4-dioxygenase [Gammaproteobacteria bacterium]NNC78185.1 3-hydroxyanthranilate 3,4-dioxygenase [Woeseiaceae bacterium]